MKILILKYQKQVILMKFKIMYFEYVRVFSVNLKIQLFKYLLTFKNNIMKNLLY